MNIPPADLWGMRINAATISVVNQMAHNVPQRILHCVFLIRILLKSGSAGGRATRASSKLSGSSCASGLDASSASEPGSGCFFIRVWSVSCMEV